MTGDLSELRSLYERPEATEETYADGVNQLEHALQCASLAAQAGAGDTLVAASLLHDVGHLLTAAERAPGVAPDEDLNHEAVAGRYLRRWFGPEVTAPIVLHVAAKRYLCAAEPGYFETLSPGSVHSLRLQGGPMTDEEAAAFRSLPYWQDAVRLRRWDDAAKVPGRDCPRFDSYLPLLERLIKA